MKIIIFLALCWCGSLALASTNECLSSQEVDEIQKSFIFKYIPDKEQKQLEPLRIERCNPDSLSYKLLSAFIFIKNLPPLDDQRDDFNVGLMAGESPYNYILKRSKFIFLQSPEAAKSGTCSSELTVAFARSGTPNIMQVCPYFAKLSKMLVSGMLVHESRHFDGKEFSHTFCQEGPMLGQLACDRSYEYGGAYGVETEYYLRLFRTSALSMELRRQAQVYVLENFVARFQKMPLDIRAGALLVDEDSGLSFFDGAQLTEVLPASAERSGNLVSLRSNMPVFFDLAQGTLQSYIGNDQWTNTEGPFADIYRSLPQEQRVSILDAHYGSFACFLYSRSVYCKQGEDIVELALPDGVEARQFVPLHMPFDDDLVMILDQEGALYTLPYKVSLKEWSTDDIKPSDHLKDYRGIAMLPGMIRISLLSDGHFARMNDTTNKYEVVPEFEQRRFKKIINPYYWSPRLLELAL